ncbi:Cobalt-precorrin-4 C(11)-methyltransferase [Leptolyngbya sp. O-77]|nr:Cobalt-precorrin-4 C(11)-methyltransferase [Leptolyngbya sp. O-77]
MERLQKHPFPLRSSLFPLPMTGTLYGVGAGPGDPELISVKGLRLLQSSPVVAFPAGAGR